MKDEARKTFTARVSQANKSELIVILYEMIEECISEAIELGLAKKSVTPELKQAREFLNELMGSLNFSVELSQKLMDIYVFVDRRMVELQYEKDLSELPRLKKVIENLRKGFEEVAKQDKSPAVMQGSDSIYAGLTYGRGSLNETVVSSNHGYTV